MREMANDERIYEGCAVADLCEGICRKKYKNTCPAFFKYKKVRRVTKTGKLSNKTYIVEVT